MLEIPINEPDSESDELAVEVLDSNDYVIARLQARIRELESNAEPNDYRTQLDATENRLKDSEARITRLQNKLLDAHQQAGSESVNVQKVPHNRATLLSKIKLQSGKGGS